jgi:hypothetical protein
MTFKTTVSDMAGNPIQDLLVGANDEINGESFYRSTDGNGFADVAMLGSCKAGDRVTFFVIDPQLRFKGSVQGDALVITAEDQIIKVVLDPFV